MPSSAESLQSPRTAALWLVVACSGWGVGFLLVKAVVLRAELLAPGISTWFISGLLLTGRFAIAAAILCLIQPRRPSRLELEQGVLLGLVTGIGVVLQTDGMSYTEASTSAFLTQAYVLFLPLVGILSSRKLPPLRIVLSSLLVLLGLFVLSRFDPRRPALGRGEAETVVAAACFTFQILALDHARYRGNRTGPVTQLMFLLIALSALPFMLFAGRGAGDYAAALFNGPTLVCFVLMLLFSTLLPFVLMNHYQRGVTASDAGVIYGMEPVFASAMALFLPGVLSSFAAVNYAVETLDARLLTGGSLVVTANLVRSWLERRQAA